MRSARHSGEYSIVVVTGASGTGKTATVAALAARELVGVRCFHFDSVGVPTLDEMERDHGGPEAWQAAATLEWLRRISAAEDDYRIAVLDGQVRPSYLFDSAKELENVNVQVVLFDCSSDVRTERLCGPRGQPELATDRMNHWAAYLRGEADALGLRVIDTSDVTITDAVDQLEVIINSLKDDAAED